MSQTPDPFSSREPFPNKKVWIIGAAVGALGLYGVWQATARPVEPRAVRAPVVLSSAEASPVQTDTDPLDQWVEWDASQGAIDRRIGGYRIEVSSSLDASGLYAARVRLTDSAGLATELAGEGTAYSAGARIAVTRLNPADPVAQVLVSSFSGGAHCCVRLLVLETRDGSWRTSDLGSWDGDGVALPTDLDGDGDREFRFRDQAFLYAFAPYSDSWSPPVVKALINGRVEDVSSASGYRAVFTSDAAQTRTACLERSNGACASYVASSARAGRLDAAWTEMLGAFDQAADWDLPVACRVRTSATCPAGAELTFSTYPEALQWFLGEHGYAATSYVAPLDASGPSFDCGSARTPSERAICGTPALGMLDRTLAVAYARASALSRNRAALRTSQRAFQAARRDLADAAALTELYEIRIRELLAVE